MTTLNVSKGIPVLRVSQSSFSLYHKTKETGKETCVPLPVNLPDTPPCTVVELHGLRL